MANVDLDAAAERLAPRLVAYALGRTGSRADAEDIAQDALAGLVRCWRRDGPPESPEAYVFAIAKRRAGRVVARRALLAPIEALRNASGFQSPADHALVSKSELAAVLAAIRRMGRRDREPLLLRVVGELGFEEIAALVKSTPAAVKMRISRARRRLAAVLAEEDDVRGSRTA